MKKNILFLALMFFYLSAHGQFHLKIGLAASVATGDMNDYYYGGPGVDVNAKYLIAGKFGIGVTSGFQHFFGKDWGDIYDNISFNIVPIRGSFGYYFGKGVFRPYVGAELGLNLTKLTYSYDYYDVYNGYTTVVDNEYSHARFGAVPFTGFLINLGKIIALDFNLKYNLIAKAGDDSPKQNATYLSANFGVVFKIGEK
jgi:hypothetical protein